MAGDLQLGRDPWTAQWALDVARLCEAHGIPCPVYHLMEHHGDAALLEPVHMSQSLIHN